MLSVVSGHHALKGTPRALTAPMFARNADVPRSVFAIFDSVMAR
jgi:hypothetical protein